MRAYDDLYAPWRDYQTDDEITSGIARPAVARVRGRLGS
jgi:hypothetical protein